MKKLICQKKKREKANNCFDLTLLLSRNLLFASLGKFRANVRNAGQANVRLALSARRNNREIEYERDCSL
jgi:hypothetical protein